MPSRFIRLFCTTGFFLLIAISAAFPQSPSTPVPPPAFSDEKDLRSRAQRGDAEAQYWLAMNISLGTWGQANDAEAMPWMDLAAAQTYLPACRTLARIYYNTPAGARRFFVTGCLSKAAELGDATCQTTLAILLMNPDVPSARDQAIQWLEKAVKAKYAPAMNLRGNWLQSGLGYEQDDMQAAEAYLQAVLTGSFEAAYHLGHLYLKGGRLKADADKAELWLRHACYSGEPKYMAALSMLLAHHPNKKKRQPEEALILAREAEAFMEAQSHPDILFALALAWQASGEAENAQLYIRRARHALDAAQPPGDLIDLPSLTNCEKAWLNKQSWSPAHLAAKPGGKPLAGEIIHEGSPYLRRWLQPVPTLLEDPLPMQGISIPPPLEQPTWTGQEPLIYDEDGEATVTLPTLIPAEAMQLYGYRQESNDLIERANKGDSQAAQEMAIRMIYILTDKEAHEAGLNILRRLASNGYPPSIRSLGWLHSYGHIVEKDDAKAFACFHEAGMAGDAEGLFQAARCLEYGIGVAQNPWTATMLLRRAVIHDHLGAQDLLAVKLLESRGTASDTTTAVKLLLQAAGHGYPESQFRLASLHALGKHVQADARDSFFWATRASRQGHEKAQFILAVQLLQGQGCEKDPHAAAEYLLSSAQAPYLPAIRRLADLYQTGSPVPADSRRAEAWLRRAAHLGNALDKARLAEFLIIGMEGSTKQPEEAGKLLDEALAGEAELDRTSQIEFTKVTAQVYAGLEKWAYALDQERSYLTSISRPPLNLAPDFIPLREASMRRQALLMQAVPVPPRQPVSDPEARPLPADTILQEADDKQPAQQKPRKEGPGWDIPWGAEV
ncbi:TPR repeat protein [Prosthecobacter fusiformis]|uniref:TPR repeat protein n=1 Tax=Prosthecobacter fusiformis TaxID=48464 RepID=A0A4R7RUE1_9BACT|nr:tetratricopeptide repeat protein [Prosthecobacter fusiformis]TDU69300.1 TPR repeat protein [Prosthecobacter fusiformis]